VANQLRFDFVLLLLLLGPVVDVPNTCAVLRRQPTS
jgi:hypothetical protein